MKKIRETYDCSKYNREIGIYWKTTEGKVEFLGYLPDARKKTGVDSRTVYRSNALSKVVSRGPAKGYGFIVF